MDDTDASHQTPGPAVRPDVYVVVKLTAEEWDRLDRGRPVVVASTEAVLGADELRRLNLWDAATDVGGPIFIGRHTHDGWTHDHPASSDRHQHLLQDERAGP
jgi:hypothetical protein